MHYEIYKNARDASWRFLIQHKICSLPVDLKLITSTMKITVRKDNSVILHTNERFAIGVLAPACVLWGIGIKTAEEIADLCNISITSAKIRGKRMQELYDRNKFLTSPLEHQVFEQFSDFINSKKQNL